MMPTLAATIKIAVLQASAAGIVTSEENEDRLTLVLKAHLEPLMTDAVAEARKAADREAAAVISRVHDRCVKQMQRADERAAEAIAELEAATLKDAFDHWGFFVYCLWGENDRTPVYVGRSENILGRLGAHSVRIGTQFQRVTLLRCKSKRAMFKTEERLIRRYRPPLNIAGLR